MLQKEKKERKELTWPINGKYCKISETLSTVPAIYIYVKCRYVEFSTIKTMVRRLPNTGYALRENIWRKKNIRRIQRREYYDSYEIFGHEENNVFAFRKFRPSLCFRNHFDCQCDSDIRTNGKFGISNTFFRQQFRIPGKNLPARSNRASEFYFQGNLKTICVRDVFKDSLFALKFKWTL